MNSNVHIKKHRSFLRLFFIMMNACLGSFLFGYFLSVYNPIQKEVAYVNGWVTDSNLALIEGLISAVIPLGALFGALASGWLSMKVGRKNSFFLIDFICIVGCSITMIIGLPYLIIGRAICGFVVGLNSAIVPLYVREISPVSISGIFGGLIGFMLSMGILVSFLLGNDIPFINYKAKYCNFKV
jgi:MFS family permease